MTTAACASRAGLPALLLESFATAEPARALRSALTPLELPGPALERVVAQALSIWEHGSERKRTPASRIELELALGALLALACAHAAPPAQGGS